MSKRFKNVQWSPPCDDAGNIATWDAVNLAVLMDIRDELQTLNNLLRCPNFSGIPFTLNAIKKNTTRRKRKPTP